MRDLVWGFTEETGDPALVRILTLDYLLREYPGQPLETWENMPAGDVDLLIELGRLRGRVQEVRDMMKK